MMREPPGSKRTYTLFAYRTRFRSFTKSTWVESSGYGIRVNCNAPDHTITPGNQGNRAGPVDPATWKQHSDEAVDAMNRLIPLGRDAIDMECGDAAPFLASRKYIGRAPCRERVGQYV